jgi:Carboxypeptidase regulatory-like domain/TonB-dependent Receptor Plug Domain
MMSVLCCLAVLLAQAPFATIRGQVVDATGLPLVGVIVTIKNAIAPPMSVTDSNGDFSIVLSDASRVTLAASLPGFEPKDTTVPLPPPASMRIVLELGRVSDEVRVIGDLPRAKAPEPDSRFALTPLDVVRTPGAQGDLMRALATLPGANRIDDGTGLFVRGGDVSEVLVMLDGVPLNHPYRYETPTGGFRGEVDPFLTAGLSFTTGGFSATYGNALSAVLDLEGLARPQQRQVSATGGLAGVSASIAEPIAARAGIRGPLRSRRRRAWMDHSDRRRRRHASHRRGRHGAAARRRFLRHHRSVGFSRRRSRLARVIRDLGPRPDRLLVPDGDRAQRADPRSPRRRRRPLSRPARRRHGAARQPHART